MSFDEEKDTMDMNKSPEKIDVLCKRIIAKKCLKDEAILFNLKKKLEIPVDLCILEGLSPAKFEEKVAELLLEESSRMDELIVIDVPTEELLEENQKLADTICGLKDELRDFRGELECIDWTKLVICTQPEEKVICGQKICITFKFKVYLLLRFCGYKYILLKIPEDMGSEFCFGEGVNFPVIYKKDCLHKELSIDPLEKLFVLKLYFKIEDFEGQITPENLDNPTLESIFQLKNIKVKFDIDSDSHLCGQSKGTLLKVFVTADIIIKIGIDQDILISGSVKEC